ncbi:MAG: ABC transporter substrate-binding protein [Aquificaceae bacterium]|uniref:ABC transporter substrate-binding protein n=1 Tax=Hydrogenobacter sp. Uz 6-8 TaxID=3384828 RepID=UPI0038FCD9FC
MNRREFTIALAGAMLTMLYDIKSAMASPPQDVEKPELTIGFIPITCATPLLTASINKFFEKYGLKVKLRKFSGWAEIRDAFISGEIDGAHLLAPLPIALSLGVSGSPIPTRLVAMQNINGQAITLSSKYRDKVKGPADFKGMVLAVPFDFSMHNFLLRHYLASAGVDPNKDVQIRAMRPPDMVAALAAGNIDGYLAPDPFNQRAVYEGVGFIYMLSKELWNGHPCCSFAVKEEFSKRFPNTYRALQLSFVESAQYARRNRQALVKDISAREYLNQPEQVVSAVLTGNFEDGKGRKHSISDRIDFDPYPWKSFAVWIISQMARWDYLKSVGDPRKSADAIYDTEGIRRAMTQLGLKAPNADYKTERIMGKTFDVKDFEKWRQGRV